MLQALLAERFHLKIHYEQRDLPSYALVVGKSGSKLKQSAADDKPSSFVKSSGAGTLHMEVVGRGLEVLARQLSITAGRPVSDRTGLTGNYTFQLDWLPENRPTPPDSDTPNLFTALREQLGLRLEPISAPVKMLVIDHVERLS